VKTYDTLRSVREDYFGGEPAQAEATLLPPYQAAAVTVAPQIWSV
jgi:hypothetical protein